MAVSANTVSHRRCPSFAGVTLFGLDALNTAPPTAAEAALRTCCASHRWARRMAEHRPYPDIETLLAAADEASYDLTPGDLAEALIGEAAQLPAAGPPAARTALDAAHAAYESRFGHTFVICLDGYPQSEHLDHVLAGIRARLGNSPDEERIITGEELRRLTRGRLIRLASGLSAASLDQLTG